VNQSSALESSDDESYVQITTPLPAGTLDVETSTPLIDNATSQLKLSNSNTPSVGDAVVLSTREQQPREEGVGDVVVSSTNPLSALLIHTNAIWRIDYDSLYRGHIEDGYSIPLFDSSLIIEDFDNIDFFDDFACKCYQYDRHQYYVDLFFQMRFFSSHNKKEKRSSPLALLKSWEAFVERYRQSPGFWMVRFRKERERFIKHTLVGAKLEVHLKTTMAGFPCGVRLDQECPFCYPDSPKLPHKARLENTQRYIVPINLRLLMMQLDVRCLDEAKESDTDDYDRLSDEHYDRDESLRMQQLVATSHLEIHRLKRSNQVLSRQINNLVKQCDDTQKQHKHELIALTDIVQDLSDKIRSSGTSDRKRKYSD